MGHLASRARIAGILSLCLLLSSFGASGALGSAAPPQTAAPQANAITIGANSCQGSNACFGAVGPIGHDSCNGVGACSFTTGPIGDNSCIGDLQCQLAPYVGDNSCASGYQSCTGAHGVGDNSCNGGTQGCFGNTGPIGDNSCNSSGSFVCSPGAVVGDFSCNSSVTFECSNSVVADCAHNTIVPAECLPKPDAQIRRGSGSYVGDDIYFPQFQGVGNNGVVGQKLTFFILIENDAALSDSFKVKRSGFFNEGFRVRYYDALNNDVTGKVNAGTFTTPELDPLGAEDYVMRATVKIRPQATACSGPVQRTMKVTSVNNSTVKDEVTFATGLIAC